MRSLEILVRPQRDDARRIDGAMRHIIVTLDMVEINGLRDPIILVKISQIAEEMGIVRDSPHVAFEVNIIDGIEADQRHKQAPVGFHDPLSEEIPTVGKLIVEKIERVEE